MSSPWSGRSTSPGLHRCWRRQRRRRREFPLATAALICAVLVGLALIGTFSPFFQLFAPD
jgi:hypothetical protein